jgi:hypothetical protein
MTAVPRPARKVWRGPPAGDVAFLRDVRAWRASLTTHLASRNPTLGPRRLALAVQDLLDRIFFLRLAEDRGIAPPGRLRNLADGPDTYRRLLALCRRVEGRGAGLFSCRPNVPGPGAAPLGVDDAPLQDVLRRLDDRGAPFRASAPTADVLGRVYEQSRARAACRAGGIYYTPAALVGHLVGQVLGRLLEGKTPREAARLRVLDTACGAGAFLLGAYQYLLDWHRNWFLADGPAKYPRELVHAPGEGWRLTAAAKERILLDNLFGLDVDPQAVAVTKRSLLLLAREGHGGPWPDLRRNVCCGDALLGGDHVGGPGGFDAVIGNPPWGQKAGGGTVGDRRAVRERFPSCRGIYDHFRPFVEQGVRLLVPGGVFGMVLPDIVLLKNYEETRRYLLEQLTLEGIDWWAMPFASAVMDAATIVGSRRLAPAGHRVRTAVHDPGRPVRQEIPQADFWANPRLAFNLYLTPAKRRLLRRLEEWPRLEDFFEVHEGVHSGNVRRELFVPARVDESCRELYFGRGEIRPYQLRWAGGHLRLAALPATRTRRRYANLGRRDWHERDKLLVRRTGDHVLAAVDHGRRYASNNFFLVFPRRPCALDLDGLCALLNSGPLTWYFQAVEPRRRRVFAELKIKHLGAFPLPLGEGCARLNGLGRERAAAAARLAGASAAEEAAVLEKAADQLDAHIEELVRDLFGLAGRALP